jgi:hypothetical protein
MEKKKTYEWVFVMSKGDDVYLTENQYQVYFDHWKEGQLFFGKLGINPSFVVQFFKREADGLFDLYPCVKCYKQGYLQIVPKDVTKGLTYEECPVCKGTGLDFSNV